MQSNADTGDIHSQHAGSNSPEPCNHEEAFGDPEERKRLEKKLLRKIDARMSILIVIYILNYVGLSLSLKLSCASGQPGSA